MNKSEIVQSLWQRIKGSKQSHEDLVAIFQDYQDTVTEFSLSSESYRAALLRAPEEFPDLQRLVGRKHDEILKGRLIDAISSLKKKTEAIEAPDTSTSIGGTSDQSVSTSEEPTPETHIRNKPTLRME